MKKLPSRKISLLAWLLALLVAGVADAQLTTGPQTEQRFPPLQVADDFQVTLFACDPLIEYPSVLSIGPRPGTMFLAHDYLTGLGVDIVRRDEVRLVEDTDGDGYADKTTVYAGEFHSIQGLAYHEGTVYVMHAPLLTALRDTNGDGVADERRDLVRGLGLPPEENPPRLHCANGVVVGHDGWLYLALGDHGCDVQRIEGDRFVFEGGGILRCRPDGRNLHVFSSGLRNIYDVALDEHLNVFVRDNENDGGDYKIRVCYCFFGSDHGYPYLYYERPEEALPPLADLGLGSSAGGVCYLETAFPATFHGALFFCEWGRSLVSYQREPQGSWFAEMQELEFASGATGDPYGFKPVDVVVDWDGSLLVADWADGQRPKRGRGRVYRIRPKGTAVLPIAARLDAVPFTNNNDVAPVTWIEQLNSASYHARVQAQMRLQDLGPNAWELLRPHMMTGESATLGRLAQMHAVWIAANTLDRDATDDLFHLAADAHPDVALQAVRALADLYDPQLNQHRAERAVSAELSGRLAAVAENSTDPRLQREVIVALGRWQWQEAPAWLALHLDQPDVATAHAAQQTLRRCNRWLDVLALLDRRRDDALRTIALRAAADPFDEKLVEGLILRLRTSEQAASKRDYADLLTRVYRRPGPWVYWGYRPAPRPANTVDWEMTGAIAEALDHVLASSDSATKLVLLRRMQREQIPPRVPTLIDWLEHERNADAVAAILDSLRPAPADQTDDALSRVITSSEHADAQRLAALEILVGHDEPASADRCLMLAHDVEEGAVLAALLRRVGRHQSLTDATLLVMHSQAHNAEVRAAAIWAIGELQLTAASEPVLRLLDDDDVAVRTAAAVAAGRLKLLEARDSLLRAAQVEHAPLRSAALESLLVLEDARAVEPAVAGLTATESLIASLEYLQKYGGPAQRSAVTEAAHRHRSVDVLVAAIRAIDAWRDAPSVDAAERQLLEQTIDALQGQSAILVRWRVAGPVDKSALLPALEELATAEPTTDAKLSWQTFLATGIDAQVQCRSASGDAPQPQVWLAQTNFVVDQPQRVQFLLSGNSAMRLWLDGQVIHQRGVSDFQPDSDRVECELAAGQHRLLLQLSDVANPRFHVRFRAIGTSAEHDRLIETALGSSGNVARGRDVFLNAEKSQCVKCHRLRDQGGRVGPELTGIGRRFARIHLIESILQPGRTVGPGFQSYAAALQDGRVIVGIRISETADTIILGDNQGQLQELKKSDIEQFKEQAGSVMPDGLEKRLSQQEFVDLIAFLSSLHD